MTDTTKKPLKRVKETFNIFDDGRNHNPAPQKFLLSALQRMVADPKTHERIKLNEAVGYYGHKIRQLTKLRPDEQEIVNVKGKPVLVDVVPAVRTASLEIDDEGNVTHEQEFLDNDLGKAALSLYEQGSGGFSLALDGSLGRGGAPSVAKSFSGFDFVMQPNFIPKTRASMLLSSMADENNDQAIISSLLDKGFEQEEAENLLSSLASNQVEDDQSLNELIISHLSAEKDAAIGDKEAAIGEKVALIEQNDARSALLSSVLDDCPFLISDEQKSALINMSSEDDVKTAQALLSSMAKTDMSLLPHSQGKQTVKEDNQNIEKVEYPSFDNKDGFSFQGGR